MARFYGEIGFGDTVETAPGVWEDVISERKFIGDVPRNTVQSTVNDEVNNDITLSNSVSIVGTSYAFANTRNMRYVRFEGELWTISSIEVQRPRLILTMGGVYNGPTAPTPDVA
jgi:hypothetical protein